MMAKSRFKRSEVITTISATGECTRTTVRPGASDWTTIRTSSLSLALLFLGLTYGAKPVLVYLVQNTTVEGSTVSSESRSRGSVATAARAAFRTVWKSLAYSLAVPAVSGGLNPSGRDCRAEAHAPSARIDKRTATAAGSPRKLIPPGVRGLTRPTGVMIHPRRLSPVEYGARGQDSGVSV